MSGCGPSRTKCNLGFMSAVEVDCVAKFDGQPLARNNRIMAQKVLNQHCALAPALESILLVLASKIVLQHNREAERTRFARSEFFRV